MIPVYRDLRPGGQARLRRMRLVLTLGILGALGVMGWVGEGLVALLYDDRYLAAGGIVTLLACALMPGVVGMTYDQAALAADDGRGYFRTQMLRAVAQTGCFLAGAQAAGLTGALAGLALGGALGHLAIVALARRHRVWDARHDAIGLAVVLILAATVLLTRGHALPPLPA
jgi:O-antigen/teichoic acid export membrane protein